MNVCRTTKVYIFDLVLLCIILTFAEDITALPVVDNKLQYENGPSEDNSTSSFTSIPTTPESFMDMVNNGSTITPSFFATTTSNENPSFSGSSYNFGYTELITENETMSYSDFSKSTTSSPMTTTDLQLMVTADSSLCPVIVVTPEFISKFFGQSASFTGTVESYSHRAIIAIWLRIGQNKTEVIDINKDKYAGSRHLPRPLLRINDINFDDEVRYQLQVRISEGWCHGNIIRLEVNGTLRFNDSCNMTKECDERYHLECSQEYGTCICASDTYRRNEICFNRTNLRANLIGSEITTSYISVWWDDPFEESNLIMIKYYTIELIENGGSLNINVSVGRENNYTFESYFAPGYLYNLYITSTVVLSNPTEIINVTSWIPLVVDPLPPGPIDVNASKFNPDRLYLEWAVPNNDTFVNSYRVEISGVGYYDQNFTESNNYTWPNRLQPGEVYNVTITARSWDGYYFVKESTGYTEQIETLRTPTVELNNSYFRIPFLSTLEIRASVKNLTDFPATYETKWQRIRSGITVDINITDTRYNGSTVDLADPKLVINEVDFYNENGSYYRCLALNADGWGASEPAYVSLYGSLKFLDNCSESRECEPNKGLMCRRLNQIVSCLCSWSYYHKDSVCYYIYNLSPYIVGVERSKCKVTVRWRHPSVDVNLVAGFQVYLYSLQRTSYSYWHHEDTVYVENVTEYATSCKLQPGRIYLVQIASKLLLSNPSETKYVYSDRMIILGEIHHKYLIHEPQ